MKQVRIGLVGAGKIARDAHLPQYAKMEDVKVVAVCDIDEERAKSVAADFGIEKYYTSVDAMLADAEIDAVDVCTWNAAHVPVCLAAAKAGKHVMCEKPAAVSVEEMQELKKVLDEKNLVYLLAVPGRFSPETITLKPRIDAGELGDLYYGKTAYVRRRGEPKGWFSDKELSGGGPTLDIGVHAIDAAWYLMGQPKPVRVSAKTFTHMCETELRGSWFGAPSPTGARTCEDSSAGSIYFANGAQLFFEASWSINRLNLSETILCGTKGGVQRNKPTTIFTEKDGAVYDEAVELLDSGNSFYNEIAHFADCIREGKRETKYDINQAIIMQTMLDAIYASSARGSDVTIDDEGTIK